MTSKPLLARNRRNKLLKILITSQHYKPEPIKTHEIAEALAVRGHEMTALMGTPNYPDGICPEEYREGERCGEFENGMHLIWAPLMPRKSNKLNLSANYLSFAQSSKHGAEKLPNNSATHFAYQIFPVPMARWRFVTKRHTLFSGAVYLNYAAPVIIGLSVGGKPTKPYLPTPFSLTDLRKSKCPPGVLSCSLNHAEAHVFLSFGGFKHMGMVV